MLSRPLFGNISMEFAATRERQAIVTGIFVEHSKADVVARTGVLFFRIAQADDEFHRVSIAYKRCAHKTMHATGFTFV